jgi:hypothetical protein
MQHLEVLRMISESEMIGIQNYKDLSEAQLPITDITINPKKDSTQSPDLFLKKIMSRLPR